MKMNITRRQLISTLVILAAITAICWDISTSAKFTQEVGTFRYESEFDAVTAATTKVAIVPSDYSELSNPVSRTINPDEQQIEDMVRKAIELQGGLDWVISKGDKVMIKVNLVGGTSGSGDGENTDVRVVKALINIINDHTGNDVEILVAEGTARTNDVPADAGSVWDNSDYQELEALPNVKLLNLNQTYAETIEITLGKNAVAMPHNGKYRVHQEEIDANVYISVPVLKIHDTGITSALKNQIGTAPGSAYGYNKMNGGSYSALVHDVAHRRWTTEEIVDLCSVANIDFVVVDAIMCLEKYKSLPSGSKVRMNTIIAGTDPVAVDHVSAKLFCLNPDDVAHITLAEKVGLGSNNPANIELVGAPIDEVKKKVLKNPTENGKFGQSNRTWVLSQVFNSTNIDEELIAGEASFEPVAGQNNWSEPVYFFDDRIDLLSYYQGQEDIITYAFSYFYSPASQEAELWIGSHEDIKVYINGESVYTFSGINVYGDDDIHTDITDVNIVEGQNTLLVKTLNKYNDYSFALNICQPENSTNYAGNRVDGLKFYTADGDTTNIQPNSIDLPNINSLTCYPNPVIDRVVIEVVISSSAKTYIDIYDISGGHITNLIDKILPAGEHRCIWNTENHQVKSGTYICVVRSGKYIQTKTLVVQ
jgi:uncharacterized protein (DUF362 family)